MLVVRFKAIGAAGALLAHGDREARVRRMRAAVPLSAHAERRCVMYRCPICGVVGKIVNECRCDPNNLPTEPSDRPGNLPKPSCDHNEMVERPGDDHAWECSKCGYVYGSTDTPTGDPYYDREASAWICRTCDKNLDSCECPKLDAWGRRDDDPDFVGR
jgi:hypothetical protein